LRSPPRAVGASRMSEAPRDLGALLAACDREPIHIPEAIQPHGMLLVYDPAGGEIAARAGDLGMLETANADDLEQLLGETLDSVAARVATTGPTALGVVPFEGEVFDVVAHRSGIYLVLEFERSASMITAGTALGLARGFAMKLEAAQNFTEACAQAAEAVHTLTGFERVMVYRFLPDGSGAVVAEARAPEIASLLNHRFPESDIPKQARALYARNHVRVIPNATYSPAPLEWAPGHVPRQPLDMSDCHLRSVSPIHLQYLRNMGVTASASISIMVGGRLWGLIACHHGEVRHIDFVEREMCRHVGQLIGVHIAGRERSAAQTEIARLGQMREEVVQMLAPTFGSIEDSVARHLSHLIRAIPADGIAADFDGRIEQFGAAPPLAATRALLAQIVPDEERELFASHRLSNTIPEAAEFAATASGALSILIRSEPRFSLTWFRAEQVETVNWAGNPHKAVDEESGTLSPRKSFELWGETVRHEAREWSRAEIDAAERLRAAVIELLDKQEMRRLNRQLRQAVGDKEKLIAHKDLLMREVHHRVQNSLQLVNSMLYLQERDSGSDEVRTQFELARQRLTAVAMVHRRLWRADKVGDVRLDTFTAELVEELSGVWDPRWREAIVQEVEPITLSTDKSVLVGLVVTELLTNAVKYAYAGQPGPLLIEGALRSDGRLELVIADRGEGVAAQNSRQSFGSRLVQTLVAQLGGTLDRADNAPGLRVVLAFPVED
jgi:light-regulated signal transduction histidine kinase (bacteriophytochrome)